MSRIDTSDIARSYLAGAGLGTQQFNILAGLQQEAEARRIQQEQFAQRQALDQQHFDLQRQDTLARLGFAQDDQTMQAQRFQWEQQLQQQQEQSLDGLRAWARERAIRAGSMPMPTPGPWAPGTPGTVADPNAQGAQPPDGPVAPEVLQNYQGAGGAPMQPATVGLLRLIDHADGNALRAAMPYLDDMEQQQKLDSMLRGIDEHIGQISVLSDPDQRALYGAFKAARDPNAMLKLAMGEVEQRQSQTRALQLGAVLGIPPEIASMLGEEQMRRLAVKQESPANDGAQLRWEVEQAAEEYKALNGKDGKAGALTPPTTDDQELARATQFPTTWTRTDSGDRAAWETAKAKVSAWNRYQSALAKSQGRGGNAGPAAVTQPAAPQPTDMKAAAAQLVQQFTQANGRPPTRDEFKQLMGGGR